MAANAHRPDCSICTACGFEGEDPKEPGIERIRRVLDKGKEGGGGHNCTQTSGGPEWQKHCNKNCNDNTDGIGDGSHKGHQHCESQGGDYTWDANVEKFCSQDKHGGDGDCCAASTCGEEQEADTCDLACDLLQCLVGCTAMPTDCVSLDTILDGCAAGCSDAVQTRLRQETGCTNAASRQVFSSLLLAMLVPFVVAARSV